MNLRPIRWFTVRRGVPPPRPVTRGGLPMDHSRLARVIERVSDGWRVDYEAVRRSSDLAAYRREIAAVDPDKLDRDGQLAFWLNAHNASMLSLVAERMPVRSVLAIDGAFDRVRFHVGRRELTAMQMEHGKIRRFGDPLACFGLNRACVGGPPLVAFEPDDIDAQLTGVATRYLADEQRGARLEDGALAVSRLLRWFARDIAGITAAVSPSRAVVAARPLLPEPLRGVGRVRFLPWDWTVNGG